MMHTHEVISYLDQVSNQLPNAIVHVRAYGGVECAENTRAARTVVVQLCMYSWGALTVRCLRYLLFTKNHMKDDTPRVSLSLSSIFSHPFACRRHAGADRLEASIFDSDITSGFGRRWCQGRGRRRRLLLGLEQLLELLRRAISHTALRHVYVPSEGG